MIFQTLIFGTCYGQGVAEFFNALATAAYNGILASANIKSPIPMPPLNETIIRVQPSTEEEAKYYFAFATLSYCNSSVIYDWKCRSCHDMGPGWKAHGVMRDPRLETQGVIAVNHQRKEIGISIRGSDNLSNQIQNALFELVSLNGLDQSIKGHLGFRSIATGLQTEMIQYVRTLLEQGTTRDYSITMAGHSMGGAVALLLTLDLQREYNFPWSRFSIYTYGQPRVGNLEFVKYINSLPLKLIRVVNENDIVPHLPPNFEGYFHTLYEMYLHNSEARLCSSLLAEDDSCSRSQVGNLTENIHDFAWDKVVNHQVCLPHM